jgi:hypothetical protein
LSSSTGTNGTETDTERSGSRARPDLEVRERQSESEQCGHELVCMMVECVDSIAMGNHEALRNHKGFLAIIFFYKRIALIIH